MARIRVVPTVLVGPPISPSVACETDSETPQQGEVNRVPSLLCQKSVKSMSLCQKSVKSMSIRSSFRLVRSADIGRLYFLRFTVVRLLISVAICFAIGLFVLAQGATAI